MTNGEVTLEVLNPTGIEPAKVNKLAPRPDTLNKKRVGLLWNGKPGADLLLKEIGKLLKNRYPDAEIVTRNTSNCCAELPAGELEGIAKDIDVAIHAAGD